VFTERKSVGLDVHARSVAAAAIDGVTGELVQAKLTPSHEHIRSWLAELNGPVAVAYEAGPTGFGLSRSLNAGGIRCEVVAPSKLQRPSGDRVKTDARDAVHLARLLRLDEITAVTVPTVEQEAARDLVRAREDARGDLMRARHRLSKLLLRQGHVYSGGQAWTDRHDMWLRQIGRHELITPATRATFKSDYDAVLSVRARRDRLDVLIEQMAADCEFTPLLRRLGCLRGIGTLTGFALAVEIGDWDRFTGKTIGSFIGLVPSEYCSGQSRVQGSIPRPATPTCDACSSRPPGTTDPPTGSERPCATAGTWPAPWPGPAATRATGGCTTAGTPCEPVTSATPSPPSRSPANCPVGAGRWQSSKNDPLTLICFVDTGPRQQREERPAIQL
jgi:transposase